MKPCVENPILLRGREFGGSKPLFCIPLVAGEPGELVAQAEIAGALEPDLVEWRADFSKDLTPAGMVAAGKLLREVVRDVPVIFTLRKKAEGGAQEMPPASRREAIEAVLRSGSIDVVDLELANEPEFLESLIGVARQQGVRVILAFHDFQGTPKNDELLAMITSMNATGADIAKIAVMPKTPGDALRMLAVTAEARRTFPKLPLALMSMGGLGSITRTAGFLYGSDMAFAVGKEASAPGQIPIKDARLMADLLLRYS
jgi:3-dehydroquinate dehydratase-1